MVVVKMELWPHGDESKARPLGRIDIINDGTGTDEYGNYKVRVHHAAAMHNRSGYYKTGHVQAHERKRTSPYHLLFRALAACLNR